MEQFMNALDLKKITENWGYNTKTITSFLIPISFEELQ